ncbi:putative protein phosphatase 2C 55 [Cocos nucifera]|uniref:protein-serine/threonine phosphatase n=1 Tax=Cocos nucifera TaxID=13894 RepID=A0A8K0IWG1_COCNU|nr:putative protein phosphatase 2C 55 [Cocos nucifera]
MPPETTVIPGAVVAGQMTVATNASTWMFPSTPGQSSALSLMPYQAMTQATRHARRVYVGGLSATANEQSVAAFFNQVMAAIGGNTAGPGDAVVNVYVNHERMFAFVDMRSVEEASNAMALDGIIFEGEPVRVRWPTDYNPSLAATLGLGQANPNLNLAAVGLTVLDGLDCIFVGGVPQFLTEGRIRELLEMFGPLRGFNLVKDRKTGNSKGYAFCVYQDLMVTDIACAALSSIKMGDKTLILRRANQGLAQARPEQEDVLPQAQQQVALQKLAYQMVPLPTKVVCLTQVVSADELENDEEYEDIVEDMRSEGEKYGKLVNVIIPRPGPNGEPSPGVGKVLGSIGSPKGSGLDLADVSGVMRFPVLCQSVCDALLSEPNQRLPCNLFKRSIMSACNSLLRRAEPGARHLENMSSSRQILNSVMRADILYSYKGLDYCRRINGSLKNREPWGTNMVYRCFWSNATGTSWRSNFSLEPGMQDFQSQHTVPYSAEAAPDVSLDGTPQEEQFENSAVPSDQKVLGDRSLKLLSGSCYLPHPDKEETGGEDAHFICVDGQAIGVADGVGGWADIGVDAGQYARDLMSNSVSAVQEEPKGSIDPARVLEKAYSSTKAKGSSTACIIALTDQGIHAVNLGDSGFIVVRDGCTIFRSPVQQHDFNFTYQLESGNGSDLPSSAQVFNFPVAPGDVIIAGTDGLFDNLYSNEVTAVVVHAVRAGLGPQVTAQKIAALARQRAQDKNRQTPFSAAAQDAGYSFGVENQYRCIAWIHLLPSFEASISKEMTLSLSIMRTGSITLYF